MKKGTGPFFIFLKKVLALERRLWYYRQVADVRAVDVQRSALNAAPWSSG